jgi:hypothetical protein
MRWERTVRTVRDALCSISAEVDAWFDRDEALRRLKPASGRWSVDQVLEHITLTNHYLMLTCNNWQQSRPSSRLASQGRPKPVHAETLRTGSARWLRSREDRHTRGVGIPAQNGRFGMAKGCLDSRLQPLVPEPLRFVGGAA